MIASPKSEKGWNPFPSTVLAVSGLSRTGLGGNVGEPGTNCNNDFGELGDRIVEMDVGEVRDVGERGGGDRREVGEEEGRVYESLSRRSYSVRLLAFVEAVSMYEGSWDLWLLRLVLKRLDRLLKLLRCSESSWLIGRFE